LLHGYDLDLSMLFKNSLVTRVNANSGMVMLEIVDHRGWKWKKILEVENERRY